MFSGNYFYIYLDRKKSQVVMQRSHQLEACPHHPERELSGGQIGIRKQGLSSIDADESAPPSEMVRN